MGSQASVITANRDLIFFHFAFDCLLSLNIQDVAKNEFWLLKVSEGFEGTIGLIGRKSGIKFVDSCLKSLHGIMRVIAATFQSFFAVHISTDCLFGCLLLIFLCSFTVN